MATLDNGREGTDCDLLEVASDEHDVPTKAKEGVNPVAYKLVRVEGDGTLVPATEDEVMEVEYFLEDDKGQKVSKDIGGCSYSANISNDLVMDDLPGSDDDGEEENVAGLSEPEDIEVEREKLNAKLEFLDVMLQRVKEEERLRVASGLPSHSSSYLLNKTGWNQSDSNYCENVANPLSNILSADACFEDSLPLLGYEPAEENALQNFNMDSSSPSMKCNTGKAAGESSNPLTAVIPKPDPGSIKSDICLDNLTIRELHETFRATFGRETSVKDKQWLKRRISLGLTDFHEVANKQEEATSKSGKSPAEHSPFFSPKMQSTKSKMTADAAADTVGRKRPYGKNSSTAFFTDVVAKTEFGVSNDEIPVGEETTGKRMRKPTRRYIEELSEVDSRVNSGKSAIVGRDSDQGYSPVKSRSRPYWNGFDGMALVCRQDSLGGSGIQVPFVFRVRRGRPRKNCTSLLKHKPNGRAAKLVKKALCVRAARCSGDSADMKQIVPVGSNEKFVHDNKENKEHMLPLVPTDRHCVSEPSNSDSVDDASDDYVTTIRTAKGGIRRKHHRSWTLHEVVKLVEGVSHFGVGRWSDIKKLAFSSSGYRTSVDLKDKWRNLLRASYAQLQTKKEAENRRKHASVPIPAPILVRVRELAAMQPRALCLPSSSSSISRSGRIVHKRHPM